MTTYFLASRYCIVRFDKFLGDNDPIGDAWVAGMSQVRPLLLFDLLLDVPAGDRERPSGPEVVREVLYGISGGTGSAVVLLR